MKQIKAPSLAIISIIIQVNSFLHAMEAKTKEETRTITSLIKNLDNGSMKVSLTITVHKNMEQKIIIITDAKNNKELQTIEPGQCKKIDMPLASTIEQIILKTPWQEGHGYTMANPVVQSFLNIVSNGQKIGTILFVAEGKRSLHSVIPQPPSRTELRIGAQLLLDSPIIFKNDEIKTLSIPATLSLAIEMHLAPAYADIKILKEFTEQISN